MSNRMKVIRFFQPSPTTVIVRWRSSWLRSGTAATTLTILEPELDEDMKQLMIERSMNNKNIFDNSNDYDNDNSLLNEVLKKEDVETLFDLAVTSKEFCNKINNKNKIMNNNNNDNNTRNPKELLNELQMEMKQVVDAVREVKERDNNNVSNNNNDTNDDNEERKGLLRRIFMFVFRRNNSNYNNNNNKKKNNDRQKDDESELVLLEYEDRMMKMFQSVSQLSESIDNNLKYNAELQSVISKQSEVIDQLKSAADRYKGLQSKQAVKEQAEQETSQRLSQFLEQKIDNWVNFI